jgi:hypothetical protein
MPRIAASPHQTPRSAQTRHRLHRSATRRPAAQQLRGQQLAVQQLATRPPPDSQLILQQRATSQQRNQRQRFIPQQHASGAPSKKLESTSLSEFPAASPATCIGFAASQIGTSDRRRVRPSLPSPAAPSLP